MKNPTPPSNRAAAANASTWPAWLGRGGLILLFVAIVAGFYLGGFYRYLHWEVVQANLAGWQAYVAQNLLLSVLIYLGVYVLVTTFPLPAATVLTLLAGALFGRWLGTGLVSIASTTGATFSMLLSRYVLRDWVEARFKAQLAPVTQGIERDGAYYLFTLRLIPLVPFFLVNLGMGLTRMPVATYAGVSWLGMLVGTFLYVNAGTALGSLQSPGDVLSPTVVGSLVALGLIPLIIRKLLPRSPSAVAQPGEPPG